MILDPRGGLGSPPAPSYRGPVKSSPCEPQNSGPPTPRLREQQFAPALRTGPRRVDLERRIAPPSPISSVCPSFRSVDVPILTPANGGPPDQWSASRSAPASIVACQIAPMPGGPGAGASICSLSQSAPRTLAGANASSAPPARERRIHGQPCCAPSLDESPEDRPWRPGGGGREAFGGDRRVGDRARVLRRPSRRPTVFESLSAAPVANNQLLQLLGPRGVFAVETTRTGGTD